MTTTRYIISQQLLAGLAGLLPGEKSPLSPLHIDNPLGSQLTPDQFAALEKAGIVTGDHTLTEPARQILTALSNVASFAHLRVNAQGQTFDQTVHFTSGGAQTVAVDNPGGEMNLIFPADSEAALSEVSELCGTARHALTPWSVQLPPDEMQAMAALLDLRRRAMLRSLADQLPVGLPPSDPAAIAAAIGGMTGNPQWITTAVQAAATLPVAPNLVQIQTALEALVDKKLAWKHTDQYLPVPEAIQVIDRFLLLNTFLDLDAGSCNSQGRSTLTHQAWLGAGAGEFLHLTAGHELLLELTTPAATLDEIRTFLTRFDALPAPPLALVPLAVAIQNGINTGKVHNLGEETVLGRSEQADIHLLDSRASRRHSIVRKQNEGYFLNDAGSTNGTFLNNNPVTAPTLLAEGDMILIGETQLKVIRAEATPPPVSESAATVYVGDPLRMIGEAPPPPAPARPSAAVGGFSAPPDAPAPNELPPLAPILPTPATPPAASAVKSEPPIQAPPAAESTPPTPPSPETPPRWFVPPPPPIKPAPVIPPPPSLAPAPFEAPPSGVPVKAEPPKSLQCARCHEPLAAGDLVCTHCGQPVGQPVISTAPVLPQTLAVCPKCFSPIDFGARFCGTCGNKLS